ncbi:acyl--CoA ligase [Myxococcota bacterium]|nr:acyl--CoA ligase [Myxococcota bacterium]
MSTHDVYLALRDPLTDRFLIDHALRAFAEKKPEHVAVVVGDRRVTYRELDALADRCAALFAASGVDRGDRVVVALENSLEAIVCFYGALRADAIPSLVGTAMRAKRFAQVVAQAEPRVVVAQGVLGDAIEAVQALEGLTQPKIFTHGPGPKIPAGTEPFDAALAAITAPPPARRSIELDLALICWTSGSTGESKGVMLSHQNLRNSALAIGTYLQHGDDDVVLCVLPLSHTYGLFQMLVAHVFGGTLVLEKGFGLAWPIVQRIMAEKVTGFAGVPTIFASILALKNLAQADLTSLRYMTNAAYGLPAPQLLRLRELVPNVRFYAMYGQTECTRICYLPPHLALEIPASVGISFTNQECWIEHEDGTRAKPGEVGELCVRGPNVMRGYWRNPEATARALRPGPFPGEVVHHTGDLFRMDEKGYLYFVARMDDIIKTRGEKVAPLEVEAVITKIPGVIETAVVGVPDPVLGVAVKAAVVKAHDAIVTADDVKRAVRKELDEVAVPKIVEFVETLPKTASGKVKKSELI